MWFGDRFSRDFGLWRAGARSSTTPSSTIRAPNDRFLGSGVQAQGRHRRLRDVFVANNLAMSFTIDSGVDSSNSTYTNNSIIMGMSNVFQNIADFRLPPHGHERFHRYRGRRPVLRSLISWAPRVPMGRGRIAGPMKSVPQAGRPREVRRQGAPPMAPRPAAPRRAAARAAPPAAGHDRRHRPRGRHHDHAAAQDLDPEVPEAAEVEVSGRDPNPGTGLSRGQDQGGGCRGAAAPERLKPRPGQPGGTMRLWITTLWNRMQVQRRPDCPEEQGPIPWRSVKYLRQDRIG